MFAYQKIRKVGGFTLVELLVAISILATISIVGYVSAHSYIMKANNSRRITSMDTLKSSLNNYYQIKKVLPDPTTNRIYYDEKGTYVHSSTGSYGVSGHASRHFYSEDYANNFAFDPETKQFFGYGKLTDNSAFDIATALYVDTGIYKTYLDGTYDGERFPSLVRAYHSSDFVIQDSTEFLPYNPFERKVTAKLVTWSGTTTGSDPSIWIGSIDETNPSQPTCNPSPTLSLTGELMTGDCIGVGTGSTALLHISDGSELSLGSTGSTTILELKDLRYKDSEDPITSVLIKLISGEVWAEAPRLRKINENESEMQIYTTTALAAVRGTVFGVSIDPTSKNTNLSLAVGEIKVGRNPVVSDGIPLFGNVSVTTDTFRTTDGFSLTATGGFVLSGSTSSMIVPDGGKAIVLTVPPVIAGQELENPIPASTGSIDSSTLQQKLHFIPFGLGYRPVVTDVAFTGTAVGSTTGMLTVKFENPGATSYRLAFGTGTYFMNQPIPDTVPFLTGILDSGSPMATITRESPMIYGQHRTFLFWLCYGTVCSAPYNHGIGSDTFSFKEMDYEAPKTFTCPEGQQQFGGFGCQPKELVAFAPYDHKSTLSGSLGMFTTTKDQNLLVGENTFNPVSYPSKYVPAIDASGAFVSASPTCPTYNKTERLTNLQTKLGMSFFEDHGLFRVSRAGIPEVRGAYVDNCNTDSYLKYDLAPLELINPWYPKRGFAIEVSVRGAALKRTDSTAYYLWDDGAGGVALKYNKAMTGIGKFVLESLSGALINSNMSSSLFRSDFFDFNDTTFYTIRTEFRGTTISLFVNNQPVGTVENPAKNYLMNHEIYMGARPYPNYPTMPFQNQWNDIIDNIKIYRLK